MTRNLPGNDIWRMIYQIWKNNEKNLLQRNEYHDQSHVMIALLDGVIEYSICPGYETVSDGEVSVLEFDDYGVPL